MNGTVGVRQRVSSIGSNANGSELKPEVSVVMPCLNEARTLAACIDEAQAAFDRLGILGEIIVADNGSDDDSPRIARERGARVVSVAERGYGCAIRGGVHAAKGRWVIMGDADQSYNFGEMESILEQLRAGDELVIGNRFSGGIEPGAMPWLHRYVGNPLLSSLVRLFFRTPIRDSHCGLRGFQKAAYERLGLRSSGMEFASEMVIKATLCGLRTSEVPVSLRPDGRDRPPHLRSFRDGWRHLRYIVMMCPLWLYLMPGLVLLFIGGTGMLTATFESESRVSQPLFALSSVGVVIGIQLLWCWIFAEAHRWGSHLHPPGARPGWVLRVIPLEAATVLGIVLIATGVSAIAVALPSLSIPWGGAEAVPLLIFGWGSLSLVVGAQVAFGGFMVAALKHSH